MKGKILIAFLIAAIAGTGTISAQYFSFGKNRVQYEEFEWRYIQSKHFDVYYYGAKNYELAEYAAQSVEAAYKQLQDDFNHQIVSRIPVIIYDSHNDFSQTNVVALPTSAEGIGGVTDKMKNRMTVPFDGDYKDFRRTLHHELVHAVFNDMFYGGNVQSILRNNIQLIFPLWFEEGLAEYTALGWDTNTDMYIRDAVINNYLPDIPYLSGYYAYRGGQSVWNFIVEEYGREKIAEILNRIKTSRSIEYGFTDALGLTVEELSERWEQHLKERYFPEVAERENAKAIATLITERGKFGSYNTSPAISPQGDKIAFITNKRGYFDVIVIDALNGRRLKTLIKGEDNADFEELNILNPNLTWSPDGRKVALSTKSKGADDIAIVDYQTRKVSKIKFPGIDAIGSVAWSPDGTKLAFDGNVGPYQDIFVYDFETQDVVNLTRDFFSDYQPAWSSDSKTVYFVSGRSEKVELNTYKTDYRLLESTAIYQTDIYSVEIGADVAKRITSTEGWNEKQPSITQTGRLVFNSDQNGIQNLYEYKFENQTVAPITNLQSGVSQFSMSKDGSRIALNSINEGYLDIFLLKSPFARVRESELSSNYWAKRRSTESLTDRVPAIKYSQTLYEDGLMSAVERTEIEEAEEEANRTEDEIASSFENSGEIDFKNYVFSEDVVADSNITLVDEYIFELDDNITNDGRYSPQEYRLRFSTDVAYSPTVGVSTYGSYALLQFIVSDLLGDHRLALGSNFQSDLRNSDYSIQYGYLKERTNFFASYFHSSRQYQTFEGNLIRFRTFGGSLDLQYPIDKFRRFDVGVSYISLVRDYDTAIGFGSIFGLPSSDGEAERSTSSFLYPQASYTKDATLPGFITPAGGMRYSVSLSGSPGVGDKAPTFASVLGDFRQYINLGQRYSLAFRQSGAASVGPDAQTYFLGGRLGWINQRWSDNGIPFERLADTFFTLPALPLRGHEYNATYGKYFGLLNTEFRFPLFAAVVPGAVPILPFYNITGAIFFDVGTAWGYDIDLSLYNPNNGENILVHRNSADLDFKVGKQEYKYIDRNTGVVYDAPGEERFEYGYIDGDILMGSGFGLRTIVFGLPFRYDVGWAVSKGGFQPGPIHYFSIGIDF